jgi:hydrogenase maturation protein HypF
MSTPVPQSITSPVELAIALGRRLPDAIGLGAYLKNTVSVVADDTVYVSHDVGNLDNADTLRTFENTVATMAADLGAKPEIVAHDFHPDFPSTRLAQSLGLPTLAVQHHHAHIAAVVAENGERGPVIGLALDGFGLGPSNESWGGELLLVDGSRCHRLGHLARLVQPGGDAAAREPWRMAAGVLYRLGRADEIATRFADMAHASHIAQLLDAGINCPETSSAGRLFDAVAGLLGIQPLVSFEGQAPMALENLVDTPRTMADGWRISDNGVLDLVPLLDRLPGMEPKTGAELFHGTLIEGLAKWAIQACHRCGIDAVALGGGCFFNKVISEGLARRLRAAGIRPLFAGQATPGDSAVSLGQAVIAAMSIAGGR